MCSRGPRTTTTANQNKSMAIATKKSPAIENLLTSFTGRNRVQTVSQNKCVMCGGDATEFRNEISRREYSISGMCGVCQDKIFGKD